MQMINDWFTYSVEKQNAIFLSALKNVGSQHCGLKALAAISGDNRVGLSRGYFDRVAILYLSACLTEREAVPVSEVTDQLSNI